MNPKTTAFGLPFKERASQPTTTTTNFFGAKQPNRMSGVPPRANPAAQPEVMRISSQEQAQDPQEGGLGRDVPFNAGDFSPATRRPRPTSPHLQRRRMAPSVKPGGFSVIPRFKDEPSQASGKGRRFRGSKSPQRAFSPPRDSTGTDITVAWAPEINSRRTLATTNDRRHGILQKIALSPARQSEQLTNIEEEKSDKVPNRQSAAEYPIQSSRAREGDFDGKPDSSLFTWPAVISDVLYRFGQFLDLYTVPAGEIEGAILLEVLDLLRLLHESLEQINLKHDVHLRGCQFLAVAIFRRFRWIRKAEKMVGNDYPVDLKDATMFGPGGVQTGFVGGPLDGTGVEFSPDMSMQANLNPSNTLGATFGGIDNALYLATASHQRMYDSLAARNMNPFMRKTFTRARETRDTLSKLSDGGMTANSDTGVNDHVYSGTEISLLRRTLGLGSSEDVQMKATFFDAWAQWVFRHELQAHPAISKAGGRGVTVASRGLLKRMETQAKKIAQPFTSLFKTAPSSDSTTTQKKAKSIAGGPRSKAKTEPSTKGGKKKDAGPTTTTPKPKMKLPITSRSSSKSTSSSSSDSSSSGSSSSSSSSGGSSASSSSSSSSSSKKGKGDKAASKKGTTKKGRMRRGMSDVSVGRKSAKSMGKTDSKASPLRPPQAPGDSSPATFVVVSLSIDFDKAVSVKVATEAGTAESVFRTPIGGMAKFIGPVGRLKLPTKKGKATVTMVNKKGDKLAEFVIVSLMAIATKTTDGAVPTTIPQSNIQTRTVTDPIIATLDFAVYYR